MSEQQWSRRRFLQVSGLGATLLSTNLLAACSAPASPAASGGEQSAGAGRARSRGRGAPCNGPCRLCG